MFFLLCMSVRIICIATSHSSGVKAHTAFCLMHEVVWVWAMPEFVHHDCVKLIGNDVARGNGFVCFKGYLFYGGLLVISWIYLGPSHFGTQPFSVSNLSYFLSLGVSDLKLTNLELSDWFQLWLVVPPVHLYYNLSASLIAFFLIVCIFCLVFLVIFYQGYYILLFVHQILVY